MHHVQVAAAATCILHQVGSASLILLKAILTTAAVEELSLSETLLACRMNLEDGSTTVSLATKEYAFSFFAKKIESYF